jgi:hypothetical protein
MVLLGRGGSRPDDDFDLEFSPRPIDWNLQTQLAVRSASGRHHNAHRGASLQRLYRRRSGSSFRVNQRLARRPIDWPLSTFHRYVKLGWYPPDWGVGPEPPHLANFTVDGE